MKRFLFFACIAFSLVIGLASCEKKDKADSTVPESSGTTSSIRITDMDGAEIKELDFGSSDKLLAFNLYNKGTSKADCQMTYSCDWISSVSPAIVSLKQGTIKMVTVQIDRSKLDVGQNTTNLYIKSENSSNMLVLKATGSLSISGLVVDANTQNPLQGVLVTLMPSSNNYYTGIDGLFMFDNLIAQQYTLTAQANGYKTDRKTVSLAAGESKEIKFALRPE